MCKPTAQLLSIPACSKCNILMFSSYTRMHAPQSHFSCLPLVPSLVPGTQWELKKFIHSFIHSPLKGQVQVSCSPYLKDIVMDKTSSQSEPPHPPRPPPPHGAHCAGAGCRGEQLYNYSSNYQRVRWVKIHTSEEQWRDRYSLRIWQGSPDEVTFILMMKGWIRVSQKEGRGRVFQ